MVWLTALKALLGFASSLAGYLRGKQLLDAGEAKAIASQLESSLNVLAKATKARRAATDKFDDANGVPDDEDPNLRD